MIFNIQRFSLHDGDGVRTVVFFKGCPLRCAWCSNPESQSFRAELFFDASKCIGCRDCAGAAADREIAWDNGPRIDRAAIADASRYAGVCPTEALTVEGEDWTAEAIAAEAIKDKVFYRGRGGLTLSGGEPFAQPDLAAGVLAAAKRENLATGAETCLAVPWTNVEKSLPHLDAVYADVKHVDGEKYGLHTGGDIALPLANLERLAESGIPVSARVPVIPGFNGGLSELEAIAAHVAGLGIRALHLMPYHSFGEGKYRLLGREYALAGLPSTPPERLEPAAEALRRLFGLEVRILGT